MTLNIADLFEAVADAIPDRVPLILEDVRLSYAELELRSNRLAHHLQSVGVEPGQHVGIHMRNCVEYVEALLACLKIRAVPINVNFRYTDAELLYIYTNSQMVALLVEEEFAPTALAVVPQCPEITHVLIVGEDYENALAAQTDTRDFGPRSNDDHFIIYTGGTTGMPKGVVWRHEDFFFAALSGANLSGPPRRSLEEVVDAAVANTNPTVLLLIPPLMHGAAIYSLLTAFLMGAPRVLTRSFDPMEVLRLVEAEKITGITVVGDAIARPIADAITASEGRYDLSTLQLIGSGGALFSPNLKAELTTRLPGLVIKDAFGASESGNDGVVEFGEDGSKRIRSNPNMILVDDEFRRIEPGSDTVGFIARAGHVPVAYFGDPAKTAATFPVVDGVRLAVLGDIGHDGSRRNHRAARARFDVHQLRRREGLPRRSGAGTQNSPGSFRRLGSGARPTHDSARRSPLWCRFDRDSKMLRRNHCRSIAAPHVAGYKIPPLDRARTKHPPLAQR